MKDQLYEEVRVAVAKLIAREKDEAISVKHFNEAGKVLWPVLSDETRASLVMR